jgi:tripartite ATP-independent transporter DctM subunit
MPFVERVEGFEKRIEPAIRYLNAAGACTSLLMVILVTAHVLSRALFKKPLVGTVELEELMIVILVFCGIAYTQITRSHISVDFVTARLSKGMQSVVATATSLVNTLFFMALTWQSLVLSQEQMSDGTATFDLQIPLFWVMWIIALGFFLFGLSTFTNFLKTAAATIKAGRPLATVAAVLFAVALVVLPFLGMELELEFGQYLGIIALLIFLFSGMLIGAALGFLGFFGMALLFGPDSGLGLFKTVPYSMTASYSLCVIPFFILMGELCFQAGLSEKLYQSAYKWVGRFRGGLSMATVLACGAFSAVSGSSLATAATMGAVSLPEMKRYKYADTLATGSIAAGGTIGILIPPSVVLIIYGILTEVSIAELFFAGIIPGLISLLYYVIAIVVWTRANPDVGPPGPRFPLRERIGSLKDTWEVLLLFALIMGGIYGGLFTPTEAGAVGATGALLFGLIRRRMTGKNLFEALLATGRTTSMVFVVVIGTAIYGYFLTSTQLPMELAEYAVNLPVPPVAVIGAIILICFGLGCIMGTLPLVFITVPIFAPVVETLGFDLIWFGVIVVVISEIGMITPPVGINVYIMKGIAKDVPLSTVFKGIFPFLIADFARLVTLIAFPWLTLFLPELLR